MSLSQNFLFWQPSVFPTGNQNIRDSNVFAVYWADVDNRVEGMCILIFSTSRWIGLHKKVLRWLETPAGSPRFKIWKIEQNFHWICSIIHYSQTSFVEGLVKMVKSCVWIYCKEFGIIIYWRLARRLRTWGNQST